MQEVQTIPEMLIYEMVNEQPVYYLGYQDYLNGNKNIEKIWEDLSFNLMDLMQSYI